MRVILALTLALGLLAPVAQSASPAQQQLVKSLGLTQAEAATLTTHQLAMLKNIKESSNLSEGEKRMRKKWILEGTVPRFKFSF